MKYTFEGFLQDRHAVDYHGTDDDMPDAFNDWLSELDGNEIMEYAEIYGKGEYLRGQAKVLDTLTDPINQLDIYRKQQAEI